jgi:DNA modification methylase
MIQLYNDDALHILDKIENNTIDLIVTDPPYDVSTKSIGGTLQTRMKVDKSLKDLENLEITEGYDISKYAIEFIRIMKEPNIYIWCNKKTNS